MVLLNIQMLEQMDLGDMGPSPGPTPQPSTVWSRGAHGHAHDADHNGHDSADEEGAYPDPVSPSLHQQIVLAH